MKPLENSRNGLAPLTCQRRFAGVLLAWVLFFLASPGMAGPDGSFLLAVGALALFGFILLHPLSAPGESPRKPLLAEYVAHTLGGVLWFYWLGHVTLLTLVYVGPAYALYHLAQGPVLRGFAKRFSHALSLALCYTGFEALRSWIPTPFGLGWFRFGHYTHHHLWLSGSARVFGIEGLSFVGALAAGGLLGVFLAWRNGRSVRREALLGLSGLALALVFALSIRAPKTREGPQVLLIQSGFEQERLGLDPHQGQLVKLVAQTREAIEALRARQAAPVDLVCWGESMLYLPIADESFRAALARGERPDWWTEDSEGLPEQLDRSLRHYVLSQLFGEGRVPPILDPGTWFSGGSERWYFDDELGFAKNVMLGLFDPEGQRRGLAGKQYLCPGAETLHGLERFQFVQDFFTWIGGYVPRFSPAEETSVFAIETRGGAEYRFSATLCFDNAFAEPYLEAVGTGELDFHLVASNEAWFKTSYEMDHMVAFSRILALATGRSFVRATNSGISIVLAADGTELGRVRAPRAPGEPAVDRAVRGWEAFAVPVPLERTEFPPYASLAGVLRALSVGIPFVLFLFLHRRR